jgi:hypothetical protein
MLRANFTIKVVGGVVLALGAIALALKALTPDYAGVRAGRLDAGYLNRITRRGTPRFTGP